MSVNRWLGISLAVLTLGLQGRAPCPGGQPRILLADSFDSGQLDTQKWKVTLAHDFSERSTDVVNRAAAGLPPNYQLRLRAGTLRTDDRTVKFLGVVSAKPVDLRSRKQIEFDFDWNQQGNGSYLTAGILLSPTLTTGSAEEELDWTMFQDVGVPPGRNARTKLLRT